MTQNITQIKAAIQEKLEQIDIGFEEIKVFGAIRCNVHIKCVSRTTAGEWALVLSRMFPGEKVVTTPTQWYAKQNKGTCLLPTMRKGYLIAVAG